MKFEVKLPHSDKQCHLKQIDLEFSLRRKVVKPLSFDIQ